MYTWLYKLLTLTIMILLLWILSTIVLLITIYVYTTIRKEYSQIMVPGYVHVIMEISFLIFVLCVFLYIIYYDINR